jgi:hypothetical protein
MSNAEDLRRVTNYAQTDAERISSTSLEANIGRATIYALLAIAYAIREVAFAISRADRNEER